MMRRHAAALLVLPLTVALSAACAPETADDPRNDSGTSIRVVDASGSEVVLGGPAHRIVSLVPSATETLRAIGADPSLVGRTDFDTQDWADALPSVGGGIEPNLEAIVALAPDLVIRFEGTQDPRTPERLDGLGITHLAVRPDHVQDIYRTTELLGAVTGREAEAAALVRSIRDGLRGISERATELPRTRVAYVLGGTPPWVSGGGTYIDEMIALVGGHNVFADLGVLYSSVSPEQFLTRDIEVVLTPGVGAFDASLAPGARIEVVGDALEIPGPHVVDAAYHVAELLHGRSLR